MDNPSSANDIIEKMKAASSSLSAYQFDFEIKVKKPGAQLEQGRFYFKKPNFIRVEETGPFKHGSIAVLNEDGKVRGHQGGLLSKIVLTLDPNSNMLLSSSGWPLIKSDFVSIVGSIEQHLKDGMRFEVSQEPVKPEDHPQEVFQIEIFKPDSQTSFKRVYVDPPTMLPVAIFDMDSGKLVAESRWKDVKVAESLDDKLFRV
jgi:outer membrane lipoprotein-sorting protein